MGATYMTFEQWLTDVQSVETEGWTELERAAWQKDYDLAMAEDTAWRAQTAPTRLPRQRDKRYAVAIADYDGLGLSFWIKRSAKGEVFLLFPRDAEIDPHASYHLDGRFHQKSYSRAMVVQQRQPLKGFRGCEHLGQYAGHGAGPRIRDQASFDDIVVADGIQLTGKSGVVMIDLLEPGATLATHHREGMQILNERVYQDAAPWIVLSIAA